MIAIFNRTFFDDYNTQLVCGGDEPIYLPATTAHPHHRVIFAHGFYASGLHEIAHWCVAGPARRLLEDFGYWYAPDGRTKAQQAAFEEAEIRPQAYEWILAQSAGFPFDVSCDNLSGGFDIDRLAFKRRVLDEVQKILLEGLPPRVMLLAKALAEFYQMPPLTKDDFKLEEVRYDY
nr:elongation factor P hydroxylase [Vibrio agarilyticus]